MFSALSLAKEVKSDEVDTSLRMIKVESYPIFDDALVTVAALSDMYDVLTLKGEDYNVYLVNISPHLVDYALEDVKSVSSGAYEIEKTSFKTEGVFLLPAVQSMEPAEASEPIIQEIESDKEERNADINVQEVQTIENTQNNVLADVKNIISVDIGDAEVSVADTKNVSLIDVVLQTISTSHKIMAGREKMIQAKHDIDTAYASYYPSLDLAYSFGKTRLSPGDQKEDDTFERTKNYGDEVYSLKVSQNIYAGGDTQSGIQRLKARYMAAKTDFKKLLEEESLKAISAYIDVLFSRESLAVNEENIAEFEKILEIVKVKYEAGALSVGELSSIEASVSNAKSQFSRTNTKYANALEYFKFIAGESFKDTYPYEKIVHVELEDLNVSIENSLTCNNTLMSLEYQILSDKHNLQKLKALFRPKVDLLAGVDKIMDREDFEKDEEDSYYFKVILSYNLYNGGRDESEYLKAYSIMQEKSYDKEAEIRRIKWGLEKLYTSLTSLQDNMQNVQNEVNASRSMVDSYWENFKHGEQDLSVLLQAQRQLNSAELNFIQTQQDSMKDYFEILRLQGKLLPYFCIDIDNDNYLDMAKASYRLKKIRTASDIQASDTKSSIKSDEPKEEKTQVRNQEEIVPDDTSELETLLSFHENFLLEDENSYTVVVSKLKNPMEGLKLISKLDARDKAFIYESYEDKKVFTNVAYGIFKTREEAQRSLSEDITAEVEYAAIQKVGKVQNDFEEFFKLSLLDEQEVQKTKERASVKKEQESPFSTDEVFKSEFLSAPKEYFTLNITTLSSMEMAGTLVKNAGIARNSFAFYFGKEKKWVKLMMGVYATYEEAKKAMESLGDVGIMYKPVIEKIALKQELYRKFNRQ